MVGVVARVDPAPVTALPCWIDPRPFSRPRLARGEPACAIFRLRRTSRELLIRQIGLCKIMGSRGVLLIQEKPAETGVLLKALAQATRPATQAAVPTSKPSGSTMPFALLAFQAYASPRAGLLGSSIWLPAADNKKALRTRSSSREEKNCRSPESMGLAARGSAPGEPRERACCACA
jgi:hypothetical protein